MPSLCLERGFSNWILHPHLGLRSWLNSVKFRRQKMFWLTKNLMKCGTNFRSSSKTRSRLEDLHCFFLCCSHFSPFTTWFGLFSADMCLSPCHHSIITDYILELCPALELNKVHIIWWSYLRDFSLEYLLTYKKRIYFFWKNSIADTGNQTRRCGMRVHDSDHYTITAWMLREGF